MQPITLEYKNNTKLLIVLLVDLYCVLTQENRLRMTPIALDSIDCAYGVYKWLHVLCSVNRLPREESSSTGIAKFLPPQEPQPDDIPSCQEQN